jgi:RND family efflux transporter MFP subunit
MSKRPRGLVFALVPGMVLGLLALTPALAAAIPPMDCVIEPNQVIDLSSSVDGVVEDMLVDRGDAVDKDQVIVRLDSGVEQAAFEYARARANATAQLRAEQVNFEFSRRRKDRLEVLFREQALSSDQMDQTATESQLKQLQFQQATEAKRLAELDMRQAAEVIKRHNIRSPIRGVVVQRYLSPGESVEQRPIMRLAEIDPLRAEVIIPVAYFGAVKIGQQAVIVPEAPKSGRYPARVTVVDRVADAASGTFRARLSLPNSEYDLPSGLRCTVQFLSAGEGIDSVAVPPPPATRPASGPLGLTALSRQTPVKPLARPATAAPAKPTAALPARKPAATAANPSVRPTEQSDWRTDIGPPHAGGTPFYPAPVARPMIPQRIAQAAAAPSTGAASAHTTSGGTGAPANVAAMTAARPDSQVATRGRTGRAPRAKFAAAIAPAAGNPAASASLGSLIPAAASAAPTPASSRPLSPAPVAVQSPVTKPTGPVSATPSVAQATSAGASNDPRTGAFTQTAGPTSRATPRLSARPVAAAQVASAPATQRCHTVGPFVDAAVAASVRDRLADSELGVTSRTQISASSDRSYAVLSAVQGSALAASGLAGQLRMAGLGDVAVVRSGQLARRVAAGVFRSEAAARERLAAVNAAGFDFAVVGRENRLAHTWLDVTGPASPRNELLLATAVQPHRPTVSASVVACSQPLVARNQLRR